VINITESKNYPEVVFVWEYTKEGDSPSVNGGGGHDPSNWAAQAALKWTFWEWGKDLLCSKTTGKHQE